MLPAPHSSQEVSSGFFAPPQLVLPSEPQREAVFLGLSASSLNFFFFSFVRQTSALLRRFCSLVSCQSISGECSETEAKTDSPPCKDGKECKEIKEDMLFISRK